MKKLRIAVLMGGMSIEREVSFNSGRTVCDHLDTFLYDVIPLFHTPDNKLYILPKRFLHRGKISDFEKRLAAEAAPLTWDDLPSHADFVYIAVHGRYAEDGTIQAMLELLKLPYLGAKVRGSALGMDKVVQKQILRCNSIPVANDVIITPACLDTLTENLHLLDTLLTQHNLHFPVVVKPAHEGSSLGIQVVKKREDLLDACLQAMTIDPQQKQNVLIEEKLEGMEFSCIVIQDSAGNYLPLSPTEVVYEAGADFHDYQQKYMPGRALKFTPARCTEQNIKTIQETCINVVKALEFGIFGRIDGFLKKDGSVVIIDPNSLSGMGPSSFIFNQGAHAGMNHAQLINHLIKTELQQTTAYKDFFTTMNHTENHHAKLRVGVLLGGPSNEREVALDSGRNVCYKLSPHKYVITPLFLDSKSQIYPLSAVELVHNSTAEIEHGLDRSTKIGWHQLPDLFDFIFIGLHGSPGEDGIVQGALELLKLPYNGSGIVASALGMDKFKTNELLRQQGFDVPTSILITQEVWEANQVAALTTITSALSFPCIVKPHDDGCSVMVSKITQEAELIVALTNLFANNKKVAMIEEYISGTELTVGIVGNTNPMALPPSQAVVKKDLLSMEEKFLPGAGENQTPAPLPPAVLDHIKRVMEDVFSTLGCRGYARIDCFYQSAAISPTGQDRVIPLEINTLPALTPATCIFHQAAELGISPTEFIDLIVELGLENHRQQPLSAHTARFIQKSI